MEKYVSAWILTFYIYGFVGWIWESFICPIITRHKIKNSGFLIGPIVPIYGVGAIVVSLLFSPQERYISIFFEGAFVACVIEYITSYVMEKMYHRRWWDYSDKAFHVNGRVCLEGFLIFGLFSVVAVKYVQPYLLEKLLRYQSTFLIVVATSLTTILVIDFAYTVVTLTHLDDRLDEFIKDVEEFAQKTFDEFEQNKHNIYELLLLIKKTDKKIYKQALQDKKYFDKRIIKAFPQLVNKDKEEK